MVMARTTDRVPVWGALGATGAAIALSAAALALTSAEGWDFPSWPETAVELVWMLGLAGIAVIGFRWLTGRRPSRGDFGLGDADVAIADRPRRRRVARWGYVVCALAIGPLASLGGSSGAPSHLGSMTPALLLVTVFVRWPVSVVAQQVFFFGWLQPRLGADRRSIMITTALFAVSHVATATALLTVLPLGVVFALERWQTGRVRAGIATHYAINVALLALAAAS
jgi:hypothetical protein